MLFRSAYILESSPESSPGASFLDGVIHVSAPDWQVKDWARGEAIGLYFKVFGGSTALHVAIEKDLQCVEGSPEEHDPYAFARTPGKNC